MAVSRDELKKKRLKAMGVAGAQMAASDQMYDRIIAAGEALTPARDAAEAAHMGALAEQARDLQEMTEDMEEFAQAVPSNGGGTGTPPPVKASVTPSAGTAALAALNAAQPNPSPKVWTPEGDAYVGTAGEAKSSE